MRFAHTHIEKDARTRRYTDIQAHVDIQTYRTEIHTQNSHTRAYTYIRTPTLPENYVPPEINGIDPLYFTTSNFEADTRGSGIVKSYRSRAQKKN